MKTFLKILSLNLIIIALLFFSIEISIRIFYSHIKLPGTQNTLLKDNVYYDSPGLAPNSNGLSSGTIKHVNDLGFWKYSTPTKHKQNKWLFLGDSVTMGIGVESDSTFAGIINSYQSNIEVLNPSLIGYSSRDYVNIIKKLLVENKNQLKISSVFIFWCLNDIYSISTIEGQGRNNSPGISENIISFLRNNLKLYHLLKNSFTDRPKTYYLYDKNFYYDDNTYFKKSISDLGKIKRILDGLNIELFIILLPYEYQLRIFDQFPQSTLSKELSKNKIKTFNFGNELLKSNFSSSDLYLYGDGIHFSKLGHKIISNIIKDKFII